MPRKHPYVSRRSATPQFGCAKQRKQNPGAKTRRVHEGVLFDEWHVETNTCRKGTGGATAALLRAAHACCACGEGAAIRTVSASAAAAGMPIDAARASRHRAGNGCGTCYEASSKDS